MNFSMDTGTAVVLPRSEGALSDDLTLTDSPGGGVIIGDIQQDSPVARIGTLKKGDQLSAVTIHFDNLNSEEVGKILKYTEPYKTSLKLNAKGEVRSPDYGLTSSYMGSGDQTYLKLYNSKIKPHLKLANTGTGVSGPGINGKTPSIDISGPKNFSPNFDVNLKASPTIDVETPSFDINGPHGKIQLTDVKPSKIGAGSITSDFDIKSPKGAIKTPNMEFKGPSFEMPSSNLKTDVDEPGIEVKSPRGGFDVNMANAKLQGPKFETPSANFNGPNISALDMDQNLKAPKVKDVDLSLSTPNIDLEAPNIETDDFGAAGKIRFPKFKKPTFSLSGNKPKGPEVDVSTPEMKAGLKTPDVDLKGEVDLPEAKGKWKMPSLQMPSFGLSGPKGPDVDFDGSVKAPSVDVSGPDLKGNFETPDIDMKLPKGEIDANLPDAELTGGKFKLPGVKWPSSKVSLSGPDKGLNLPKGQIDLSAPDIQGDIRGPSFDGKGPNIDINAPKVDVPDAKAKFKLPSFHMPSFGFSGPKAPDLDVDGSLKGPSMDVSGPNIKGNFETPDIDLNLPKGDVDINIPNAEIQKPTFKMPKFKKPSANLSAPDTSLNLKAPKVTGDLDAKLKKPNLEMSGIEGPDVNLGGNLNIPDVDISAPDLKAGIASAGIGFNKPKIDADYDMPDMNLEVPEVKLKGPGLKKPSLNMSGANVSVPEIDLNLSKPKLDFSAPKVQGDFKGPNIDINAPNVDGFGTEGKFKFPKFKKPTFSLSGNKPKGPELDVSTPEVKADLKTPDVDLKGEVDLPEAKGKWKMPSLQMPSFGLSGPKGPDVDFDGSVKAPNVDVSGPDLKGNFETPEVDLKLPRGEIDANLPDAELTGGKFKLPRVKWPSSKQSLSGPDKGLNLPKGQIDLSGPDVQGDISGPSFDGKGPNIDINAPKVDVPDAKAKFKMPSFHMPSFGFSGPKAPDLDVDGPSMDVSGPNIKGNFETPDVDLNLPKGDVDINIPNAEIQKPTFKMPKFKKPKAPDISLNLKAPKVTGDLDAELKKPNLEMSGIEGPDVNLGGNLNIPDVDISAPDLKAGIASAGIGFNKPKTGADYDMPDMNLEVPEVKLKGPGLKKPSLNMSGANVSVPEIDLNLSKPKFDLSAPKVQGDFKGPNIDINAPNVDGFGTEGKFKFPKFKKPTFSLSGNKPKGPELDVSTPEVKADLKTPDVDLKGEVDLPEAKGKWKMPSLQMPSFGLPGPKGPDVDFDGSVKAPNVDVSGPDLKGNFETPEVDLKLPRGEIDANLPDAEFTGGKFKLPGIKWPSSKPSLSGPDKGLNLPKGQIDLSAPDIQGDIRGPSLDLKGPNIEVDAPNVDVPDAKAKFKMPSLKLPSFGFSRPKGPDVDFDGSVKAPSVDVSGPDLKGNFETPEVDLKLPRGEIDANLPDAELTGGKFKLPGIKWPSSKVSLSGPDEGLNLPKGQIDLSGPDVQGDIIGPSLDLKGPNIDVDAPNVDMPDAKAKFKMPSLTLPSFGFSGPKAPDLDVDGPSVDVSGPNIKGNFETPDVDLNLPKGDVDINISNAEIQKPTFKMPKFKKPKAPDISLNLKAPKVTGDLDAELKKPNLEMSGIEGPDVNLGGNLNIPDVDISAPDLKAGIASAGIGFNKPKTGADYDMPDMNLEVPEVKLKGPGLKKPSLNMSGANVSVPEIDLNLSKPKFDLSAPKVQGDFKGPNIDINAPNVDGFGTEGKFKFPKFKKPTFSLSGNKPKGPELDVSTPEVKADLKTPDVDLKGEVDLPEAKGKWKMPSLQMPSFGSPGPKGPDVDFDGSVKVPNVDVSGPDLKGNFETPEVDLKLPRGEIDANLPDAELTGGKFKLPGVKWPSSKLSLSGPDEGLTLPKGQIDLSGPDLQGDIKGPSIDMKAEKIDINAPNIGVPEAKSKFKMPKVELPSIRMSGPKAPDLDIDGSVKVPGVDVSSPKIKGNYESPDFGMEVSNGDMDIQIPQADLNKQHFATPSVNMPSTKGSSPDANFSLKTPTVTSGKLMVPTFKEPNLENSGIEGPSVNVGGNLKVPKADISAPSLKGGIDLKKPKTGVGFDMPDVNLEVPDISAKGTGLKKPSLNVSPGNVDLNLPTANIKGGAGIDTAFQEKELKGANIGVKDTKFSVSSPNLNGEFREVAVDVSTPIPSAQLNVPKLKVGTDENVNMQNKFPRETFKVRSSSVSDLDDTTAQGKYDANLQAKSSSTINVNDNSISKKSKFKFSKLFNFNHKSKGSVDFTKAREATSSGTFTSKSLFPELEFSVSND
ncbi:neuroblast differentiation-associated protein AHNAK isoform X1 [Pristis pectinata]|uniref:neuroblast differentiation-associated protein AHNAK isoform X1 n=1 Tax=Pristis pectinata TaxID=685728 RepID=UPI00223D3C24|nr:neuroblast differentiation-associated protein AHNAK isoform X1 [Pristis pectinata]